MNLAAVSWNPIIGYTIAENISTWTNIMHSFASTGKQHIALENFANNREENVARASKPVVGSSINIMEGLATSSTAIVSLFRCSADRPVAPGMPTMAFLKSLIIKYLLKEICYVLPAWAFESHSFKEVCSILSRTMISILKGYRTKLITGSQHLGREVNRLPYCHLRMVKIILANISTQEANNLPFRASDKHALKKVSSPNVVDTA
ncbi:hypothetical protein EJB05_47851, partial [Eragrostis curvula]